MGNGWHPAPMQITIDSGGRILLPKSLRDSLGLLPGTKADISLYGNGVQVTPGGDAPLGWRRTRTGIS